MSELHCGTCGQLDDTEIREKLDLLKQYISKQAENDGLWFIADRAPEAYLQQELRRIAWLIEDAPNDEIKRVIERMEDE